MAERHAYGEMNIIKWPLTGRDLGKSMVRYAQLRWNTVFSKIASDPPDLLQSHLRIERTFDPPADVNRSRTLSTMQMGVGLELCGGPDRRQTPCS